MFQPVNMLNLISHSQNLAEISRV